MLAMPAAAGQSFSGLARVIDGDTLDVGDVRVRVFGIDAPEKAQTCPRADGSEWACGLWAEAETEMRFGGRHLTCAEQDIDRYGRVVAICLDDDGVDAGRALTEAGAATAYRHYSTAYVAAEQTAKASQRGIWAGPVTAPEVYRASSRTAPADEAGPEGCAIKGNISSGGQIFHSPGQRDYARTRIDTAKGERWFCSTAEARAAGWRAARR